MAKVTARQRLERAGQPYTRIAAVQVPKVEPQLDGLPTVVLEDQYQIFGYVAEEKLVEIKDDSADPKWKLVWEEIDLGPAATLEDAHEVAAQWRGQLVGTFEIR